jgi:hypothetical protein
MGDNQFAQSGFGNRSLNEVYKLNYFENKNLMLKKIAGCNYFNIFLTGYFN